ncbi:MAG: amidohydrolase [Bacteroidetes bacterium HGW-Bacteroidetes-17]|nr:MAG: amidohydrolase [Bacteroidetes bacterium HGW-Bacteroidetes-17]
MIRSIVITVFLLFSAHVLIQSQTKSLELNKKIFKAVEAQVQKTNELYVDLHQTPELSLMEFKTAEKMAYQLKQLGFEVTTNFGGNGVVGVFKNGDGKTIMLRTDMDALPIKENTGLPYASSIVMNNSEGIESPVMHACGHDMHMTTWLGILTTLVELKNEWKGTILAIAQPAEEISGGSIEMINAGLFKKFPKPDVALCYHVSAEIPAGEIGYFPGPIFAGVNSVNLTIFGVGGHGAMPHTTVDPIVLASRTVLALQTIVSREINPFNPAVVTIGSIHGGSKHNIIPDEVNMQLTIRFFTDEVYAEICEAINRIPKGIAISAGLPEDKWPKVEIKKEFTPPVANNPELVLSTVKSMQEILGEENVYQVNPATVGEDFGKYGRTEEKIPIALFWLGSVNRQKYDDYLNNAKVLPGLHNSAYLPDFEPTFKTGVAAMSKSVINLFNKK